MSNVISGKVERLKEAEKEGEKTLGGLRQPLV